MDELTERLNNYPGPRQGEGWKNDKDLSHCTLKEKEAIAAMGYTIEDFERIGMTRGQLHHIAFGYRFSK